MIETDLIKRADTLRQTSMEPLFLSIFKLQSTDHVKTENQVADNQSQSTHIGTIKSIARTNWDEALNTIRKSWG
jgi:hypothetical protein